MTGHLSLRSKITLAVSVLVIVFMYVVAYVMLSFFEGILKESISQNQFVLVTALAGEIDKKIATAQQQLISASKKFSSESFEKAADVQNILNCMTGLHQIFDNQVSVITPDGRIFAEYPLREGRIGHDVTHRSYYKATTAALAPVISDPYFSSIAPYHPTIMMTAPLLDDKGKLKGILAGAMDLMGVNILNDVSKITLGHAGYLFLVTRDTKVIIMHPDSGRILKPISAGVNALLDSAIEGFEGTGETTNTYGNRMLTSFKQLKKTNWVLGANYPISEAHEMIKQLQKYFFLSVFLAAFGIVVGICFLIKYLTLPLVAFSNYIKTFQEDSTEEKYFDSGTHDEIGILVASFNQMITKLDLQKDALRKSEQKYRTIYNSSSNAILILDINTGAILDVNQKTCEMYALSYAEAITSDFGKLCTGHSPYTREDALGWITQAATGQPQLFEWQAQDAFGRVFWVLIRMGLIEIDGVNRILVTTSDISQRKDAEKALKESEERFSKAFRSSPAPMIISDIETGRIIDVNDRWLVMMGYERSDLRNQTTLELGMWPEADVRRTMVNKLLCEGTIKDCLCQIRTKQGSVLDVLWYAETIKLGANDFALSLIYDKTEKNRSEEERQKLQAQLLQAQKMESIGRLAGGVAHDYNNMLGVILGHAELAAQGIKKDCEDSVLENHIGEIINAARRSSDLTQQLLAFARCQTVAPKVLNLNQAVSSILNMVQVLVGEDIEMAWQPGPGSYFIKIDPSQLNQLVMNLCVNARDAISEKGKINIETQQVVIDESYCALNTFFLPGEFIVLIVSDNGCGMDKDTQSKIFEPFFTTKDIGKGTGLGLATVYGIVKQNNGFINVYSEPGTGTTFKIYFPYCTEIANDQMVSISCAASVDSNKTILLVEDEPTLLKIYTEMLTELGYTVLATEIPEMAIDMARDHEGSLDLMMTDVMMPLMNGRELERQIRQLHPDIICLFASGYTASVISHHGVLDNDVQFIQKPFTLKDLQTKISDCLCRRSNGKI